MTIQHWLYGGVRSQLGEVFEGDSSAVLLAMVAAVLFGAVHALMPGHGKTALVSYHLGQPSRPLDGFTNGTILALTHVGLALFLVLAGFTVISRVFAYGGRTTQFEAASGAMIVLIGVFLLWRSTRRDHHAHSKDGKTLAFVAGIIPCPLTTFIMSYALARGMLAAGLAVIAAMTVGMIATIGGIALAAACARDRFMGLLDRTEGWRNRAGMVLEVGGSITVIAFGFWIFVRAV